MIFTNNLHRYRIFIQPGPTNMRKSIVTLSVLVKEKPEKIKVKSHARKKPGGRKPLPEDLPREEITVDIPEEQKQYNLDRSKYE